MGLVRGDSSYSMCLCNKLKNTSFCLAVILCFSVNVKFSFGKDAVPYAVMFVDEPPKGVFRRPILGEHLAVWQLTDAPAVRDHANYHSVKCWSPDGRYIVYTHWGDGGKLAGDPTPGNKSSASIHIFDIHRRLDLRIDEGIDPRWANLNNWLFYTRYRPERGKLCEEGTELVLYDADNGRKRHLAYGVERQGETDNQDQWIYAKRRSCTPPWSYTTVRVSTGAYPKVELLDRTTGSRPMPNPAHPVLYIRQDNSDQPFSPTRKWYSLDGSKEKIFVPMVQKSHMAWLGNGDYLLLGDGPIRGRLWNAPYPSNLHILAAGRLGDVSACGRSGRYACGDALVADLRSGDTWQYINPLSGLAFPAGTGDISHIYDADPKGSPDGTKICFVSNYPLADGPITQIAKSTKKEDTILDVESTLGFPDSGALVYYDEVIGYTGKTASRFLGVSRGLYNTAICRTAKGNFVKSFAAACLTEQQRKAGPGPSLTMKKILGHPDSPLIWQRQTDVYVAVVRRPDRPWLQPTEAGWNLIPGESHFETYGYLILKNGETVNTNPIRPGDLMQLNSPGEYQAVALEWSGLQSLPSASVFLKKPGSLRVIEDTPEGFEWTQYRWLIEPETQSAQQAAAEGLATKENGGSRSSALSTVSNIRILEDISTQIAGRQDQDDSVIPKQVSVAERAYKDTIHHYDGLIHRETYHKGVLIKRSDFNLHGSATRQWTYRDGTLIERRHFNRQGLLTSLEKFAKDGFITESIYYRYRNQDQNRSLNYDHWFYDKGVPVKRIHKEKTHYIKKDETWTQIK